MISLDKELSRAIELHQAGKVGDAQKIYLAILPFKKRDARILYLLGTSYLQLGRLEEAAQCLQSSVNQDSSNLPAFNNLGIALKGLRKFEEALEIFNKAIALGYQFVDTYNEKGVILYELKRMNEALEAFDKAIVIDSKNALAYNNRGTTLIKLKRLDEALLSCDKAIQINPQNPEAYNNRGVVLHELSRLDEALSSFERAIELDQKYAEAFFNRGNVLKDCYRLDEALLNYDLALEINPQNPLAYCNRGVVLHDLLRLEESLASFDKAVASNQEYAEAFFNRGNALKDSYRLDEALLSYDKAICLKTSYEDAYVNRGVVLLWLLRLDEALLNYDLVIEINPQNPEAHGNKGVVLHDLMKLDDALSSFDKAIALDQNYADPVWNKSLVRLIKGEYEEGWKLYEWRWKTNALQSAKRNYVEKLWLGDESLIGKTILIYPEQGLGDFIHFSRYVPMLVEQGARVILEVPKALVRVMETLPCTVTIVESGNELPSFDMQCPIMSLPLAFKTTVETIPANIPYLFANPAKKPNWEKRLLESSALRVGLVWSGGFRPNQPEVWSINERRNIPLAKLEPLKIPGIDFYSLQKGDDAVEQIHTLVKSGWNGPEIIDYSNEFEDFEDTAALIDNLDLIIAVDTSTAHLAGAMGKPVWLLNRFDTDWRWFIDKEYSPWYPTIKIFRQPKFGDWDAVVSDVKDALAKLSSER